MITRDNLSRFAIGLTIFSLVPSAAFAQRRVINPRNYIAVPSNRYAFKPGQLNHGGRKLDELVQQSADLVCRKNGFVRAATAWIEPNSSTEKVYLTKNRWGQIVESKTELAKPWEFSFADEPYEARIESIKMKLNVAATVCGLAGACFGGIAGAIPPTAPVTAPIGGVFGAIAGGAAGASKGLTELKGLLKKPVKKSIESRNKPGGDRTALGKYARKHKFFKEDEKNGTGEDLDVVPHLVFKKLDCVPEKSVLEIVKGWFSDSKTGEKEFKVKYEGIQFMGGPSIAFAAQSLADRMAKMMTEYDEREHQRKQYHERARNGWDGLRREGREWRRGRIVKAL